MGTIDDQHREPPDGEELTASSSEPLAAHLRVESLAEIAEDTAMEQASADGETEKPAVISLLSRPPKPGESEASVEVLAMPTERPSRERSPEQVEKARRRQALYFQSRREKKRKRVFYSRIRTFLRMLFAVLLIAGLYWVATSSLWRFDESRFSLYGNHLITPQHMARFLHPLDQKPLYQIDPLKLQKAIQKEMPLLDRIVIRRHLFPVGLDVIVSEKPTWGLLYTEPPTPSQGVIPFPPIETSQNTSIIGKEAVPRPPSPVYMLHWDNTMTDLADFQITKTDIVRLKHPIPMVSGNTQLKPTDLKRYRALAQFLNSQPRQARLLYLDISNPYDIYAHFEGIRVRIGRADSAVMDRMANLFEVLPAIRNRQTEIRFVDFRWPQQVLLKKKSPEESTQARQDAALKAKTVQKALEDPSAEASTPH